MSGDDLRAFDLARSCGWVAPEASLCSWRAIGLDKHARFNCGLNPRCTLTLVLALVGYQTSSPHSASANLLVPRYGALQPRYRRRSGDRQLSAFWLLLGYVLPDSSERNCFIRQEPPRQRKWPLLVSSSAPILAIYNPSSFVALFDSKAETFPPAEYLP